MKKITTAILSLIITLELFGQSHNDYMNGRSVSGATDYVLQWIIILFVFFCILVIVVFCLNLHYKQKDKYDRIIKEMRENDKKRWDDMVNKNQLNSFIPKVSSLHKHVITIFSSEARQLEIYDNDKLVKTVTVFLSIDDAEFEDDPEFVEDRDYHPLEIVEGSPLKWLYGNRIFKLVDHPEGYAIARDYEFEIKSDEAKGSYYKKSVKLVKHKIERFSSDLTIITMNSIIFENKEISTKELD